MPLAIASNSMRCNVIGLGFTIVVVGLLYESDRPTQLHPPESGGGLVWRPFSSSSSSSPPPRIGPERTVPSPSSVSPSPTTTASPLEIKPSAQSLRTSATSPSRKDDSSDGVEEGFSVDKQLGRDPGGVCGNTKCFFMSQNNPSFGYVMVQLKQRKNGDRRWEEMKTSWRFGKRLQRTYGLQHLMRGPVQKYDISAAEAVRLNAHLQMWTNSTKELKRKTRYRAGTILVEPVRTSPAGGVLVGCVNDKKEWSIPRYKKMMMTAVKDLDEFQRKSRQHLEHLERAVTEHECLLRDFQVLISPAGDWFFFDFDDCAHKPPIKPKSPERKYCLPLLRDLVAASSLKDPKFNELDTLVDKYNIDV